MFIALPSEPLTPMIIGQIGALEILIIILIMIILFGPKKIPELARSLGQAVRIFREEASKLTKPATEPPKEEGVEITDEQLTKLAEALGINSSGKTREELAAEIIKKAKEKGLL